MSGISDVGERPQEAWLRPAPPPRFLLRLPLLCDVGAHCPVSSPPLLSFLLGQALTVCKEAGGRIAGRRGEGVLQVGVMEGSYGCPRLPILALL